VKNGPEPNPKAERVVSHAFSQPENKPLEPPSNDAHIASASTVKKRKTTPSIKTGRTPQVHEAPPLPSAAHKALLDVRETMKMTRESAEMLEEKIEELLRAVRRTRGPS
jgi:hypothetical protein